MSKMESFDWDALPSNRQRHMTAEEMAEKRAELLIRRKQQVIINNNSLGVLSGPFLRVAGFDVHQGCLVFGLSSLFSSTEIFVFRP